MLAALRLAAGGRPVLEIGAGTERLALGAEHIGADVAVAVERLEGIGDLVDQRIVEKVVRRPLDFDDADMTFAADADILVGGAHTFPPRADE
jgi:predicted RNA methylase